MDFSWFPKTDEEAEARFEGAQWNDPFPNIAPALLNSADLLDYIGSTGMIHPFHPASLEDPSDEDMQTWVKPASCAIPALGTWLRWSGPECKRETGVLAVGDELVIKRNSIVYVTLEPMFRIPPYIAARYNLKITAIYRGFLVGTGPLVDPGFKGQLSVPLHNLTSNDYPLVGGDPLVWMEFTKLSPNKRWSNDGEVRDQSGEFIEFPGRKRGGDVVSRVKSAWPAPVVSSISEHIEVARDDADKAKLAAEDAAARFTRISMIGIIGVVIGMVAIVISVYSLVGDVNRDVRAANVQSSEIQRRIDSQSRTNRDLRSRLRQLESRERRSR